MNDWFASFTRKYCYEFKKKKKILPKITKFLEYQNVNKMYKKLQRKGLGLKAIKKTHSLFSPPFIVQKKVKMQCCILNVQNLIAKSLKLKHKLNKVNIQRK